VNRRFFAGCLAALALLALGAQSLRAAHRLRASRLLKVVEAVTPQAARAGTQGRPLLGRNLQLLAEAEPLDPTNISIPVARGAQLLLLERLGEARAEYLRALALEPRAEIWLNLARVEWRNGEHASAASSFAKAAALNPRLAAEIPPGALGARGSDHTAPPSPAP
jgi:tetratricopeptide (TPR) repeat protein